jgi:hypothetical protein
MSNSRFQDQNKQLSDFYTEVWVCCPTCKKRAVARADVEQKEARLNCLHCGCSKRATMEVNYRPDRKAVMLLPAHAYFGVELWFQAPFRSHVFMAYNPEHLTYLEEYIGALLREHADRKGFTLIEKLPGFYHQAKNREVLLKLIAKLKAK